MCGALGRQRRNGRSWSYPVYICSSYNESGACGRNTVREEGLLAGVAKRISERFSDPEEVRAGLVALVGEARDRQDEGAARRAERLAELGRLIDRSAQRFLSLEDERSAEACRKQMEAWSAELKELEREEATAAPPPPSVEEQVEEAMDFHRRFQEALMEFDRPMLRRLLLQFVAYIEMRFAQRRVVKRARSAFVRGLIYRRVEAAAVERDTSESTTELSAPKPRSRRCM
jgi:hypothetical protein